MITKQDVWNWFYNSSSIVWARFQVLFGCLVLVITMTDMSQWLPKEWMPIWLVISGVISEYLRRSNTQTNTIEVHPQVASTPQGIVSQQVTYLQSNSPVPAGSTVVSAKRIEQSGYSGASVFGMVGISFGLLAAVFMVLLFIK